ncbi:MAG: glycosyltransferase [Bacteroidetes bacterium]|jgi:predicted glycosyltransferase|nr:glycosyltransferase [Bacteroidota bacterium]
MKLLGKKRVLVAPLDWGLGHATRCVPIIRELLQQGADVILAADGRPFAFLEKEFPELPILRFPGYGITYPKDGSLALHFLFNAWKIRKKIKEEKKAIEILVKENNIDIIISDNRFACRTDKTFNVYITHQLNIKTPFAQKFVNRLHKKYYEQFDVIWVPDLEGKINLSGELGHDAITETPFRYVGPLTRFQPADMLNSRPRKWWLVVLLSGPEPQRSHFEKIILEELSKHAEETLILRGVTDGDKNISHPYPHVTMMNHLSGNELQEEILSSHFVLCRPGYSTLCDLSALNVSPIVVPTPGQTEQEYLAAYHAAQNNVVNISQKDFSLREAINAYHNINLFGVYPDEKALEKRVAGILR